MRAVKSKKLNERGVALLFSMLMIVMISFIVMEVTYETTVEYAVNAGAIAKLKAHYAAQSAVDLSLLRIKIYNQVTQSMGASIPAERKYMLDFLWSFPFAWPPTAPGELNDMDKEALEKKAKESKMEANYAVTIVDEGTKVDVNDLASSSKAIRESTEKLLLNLFISYKTQNEDWARKNPDFQPEQLIGNIKDWLDSDTDAFDGRGPESAQYNDISVENGSYPPNRAFRSIEELRLVAGMTPELYDILATRLTIYGMKAINPNTVSPEILLSLDPTMTPEIVSEVTGRRQDPNKGGPFSSDEDFWGFVNSKGARVDIAEKAKDIPMVFSSSRNFKIRATGISGNSSTTITAVVFDPEKAGEIVAQKEVSEREDPQQQKGTKNQTQTQTPALPKGPPRIVYYFEE